MKIVWILLSIIGGVGVLASAIALIWQMSGRNKIKWNRSLTLSVGGLVLALVMLIVPLIVLGRNTWTEEGKRLPLIAEKTYQNQEFTVGGVTYCNIGVKMYDVARAGDPQFAYKIPATALGITNNYYFAVQNHDDLPIVTDIYGNLFCASDYAEAAVAYYENSNNRSWVFNGNALPDTLVTAMENFLRFDLQGADRSVMVLKKPITTTLDLLGTDGVAWLHAYIFVQVDGRAYYYVHSAYNEQGEPEYILIELPQEIGEPLLLEQVIWG